MTTTDNLPAPIERTDVQRVTMALADKDWEGVSDGHIGGTVAPKLPRLNLSRKSDGGFSDELTGEQSKETTFVWLADTETRAWWPKAFGKGDAAPDCRSHDGLVPDPQSPNIQAKTCAECPLGKWEARAAFDEDDKAPRPCNKSVDILAYLLDEQRLTLLRFGGMAYSRVTSYLGALEYHVPRKPPLAYVTRCQLEDIETSNGTFLVPRFSVAGEIPRPEATPLIQLQAATIPMWQEQVAGEVAAGETAEGGGGGPFDAAKVAEAFGADGAPFVDIDGSEF